MGLGVEQPINISVYVVSDEGIPLSALAHLLDARPEYHVIGQSSIAEAHSTVAVWAPAPSVVVIHSGAASASVLRLLQQLKARNIPVVILLRCRSPWLVYAYHSAGALGLVLVEARTADLYAAINAAALYRPFVDPSLSEIVLAAGQGRNNRASHALSTREAQVLKFVAFGFNNGQVAHKLKISTKSVETYRARLMEKLQLKDRTDLVRFALITGILRPDELDTDIAS